jgi:hypothetical protein
MDFKAGQEVNRRCEKCGCRLFFIIKLDGVYYFGCRLCQGVFEFYDNVF